VVKQLIPAQQTPEFLETARRLFRNEARVLGRLGQHDRIPTLIDAFEIDQEFYLVQDYVEGHTLGEEWGKGTPLSPHQVMALLQDVLTTLAFIHSQQVIHRDIKPSNLMRRRDGQIVLIDFGAVKEITTHIQTASLDQFTISIGTQGYAPPEQLAGRPRYSSDLYALGMTALHALTGQHPNAFAEDPDTGELRWPEIPEPLPKGLRILLERLTDVSVHRRYGSVAAVLADLQSLDQLTDARVDVPETVLHAPPRRRWMPLVLASLVAGLVLGVRQLGGWVPLELMIYDRLHQRQATLGPDPRLLLVEITEADLQALQRPTPSDATLATAIATLQTHQPRVIGVDLYRDLPQGNGQAALQTALAAPNVVTITKLGDRPSQTIPPPPGVPPERVGFNDLIVDPDGVIRRNLLLAASGDGANSPVLYSFGLRLALQYLAAEDITLAPSPQNASYFALGGSTFFPLTATFGAYRVVDALGYQVPLRYRSGPTVAQRISLSALLAGEFSPDWVRDRVVLIGTTAASSNDLFYTPYSRGAVEDHLMAGVTLHAYMTSQILRTALDQQPLPWAWPEAGEVAWILLWVGGGTLLGDRLRGWRGWLLGVGASGAIVLGLPLVLFTQGGWVPLLPGVVALGGSLMAMVLYRAHQQRQGAVAQTGTVLMPPSLPPPSDPVNSVLK
jgi:CHASE2 domain-containing sensor protein